MSRGGFTCIWQYSVRPECTMEFESAYGLNGDWVELFRRASGYLKTELHRDRQDPTHYVTVDFWDSEESWTRFRNERAADYEALDARCDALTTAEKRIGHFDSV